MRTLSYCVASTLDGMIAPPGGGDPTGSLFDADGDHVRAILTDFPEIVPGHVREMLGIDGPPRRWDTVIEGRRSFQLGLDAGVPDCYPHLRHYVVSRSLSTPPAPDVRLVADDPVAAVRELKAEPGGLGIWLVGGAELAGVLLPEIDEIVLKLNPVVAGAGIGLFAGAESGRRDFALVDHRVFGNGVAFLTYVRRVPDHDSRSGHAA